MFLQPDWWDPTKPGVGTNRYSYSFSDPVNGKDATWHQSIPSRYSLGSSLGDFFSSFFGGGSKADVAANVRGTGKQIGNSVAHAATASLNGAKTVIGYTPVGAIIDLNKAYGKGDVVGGLIAAAGLIPGERIVGAVAKSLKGPADELIEGVLNYEKNYFRSMSKAELAAVEETGLLRGGRAGETNFTDQRYRTGDAGARAKNRLSLPQKPGVQVEFQVRNRPSMVKNGERVEPQYGGRGGDREYMTLGQVEVEIINAQPY